MLKYDLPSDLDSPERTIAHRDIVLNKPFLKKLYIEWYQYFLHDINQTPDPKVLEVGAGGGFFKDLYPDAICSDILDLPFNDMTFSALDMPFSDNSLSHILLVDTFHHIPDSHQFLSEVQRVLRPSGKLMMSEPYNSKWGRFIYQNFHHEPFEPQGGWTIPSSGPMSDANGALPYIVFERDLQRFKKEFPQLSLLEFRYHTPLRYLLSGGVSFKTFLPGVTFPVFTLIDRLLGKIKQTNMFCYVSIEKQG